MFHELKKILYSCSAIFSRIEKIYIFSALGAFAAGLALVLLLVGGDTSDDTARAETLADKKEQYAFVLPLIVLQVPNTVPSSTPRSLVVNGSLQFKGKSDKQLIHSMRMANLLTPSIMDAIMTGMYREEATALKNPAVVTRVVLNQSNSVLHPYGVSAERMLIDEIELR